MVPMGLNYLIQQLSRRKYDVYLHADDGIPFGNEKSVLFSASPV